MAMTNYERVGKGLELLRQGLTPFVERELRAAYGNRWEAEALRSLRSDQDWQEGELHLDAHALLIIMWYQWKEVFGQILGHMERSLVSELREVRNRWAHQMPFSSDDAYRALDSIERLLTAVSAEEAREAMRMKKEVLRASFDEQARREAKKVALAPIEGQAKGGLKPWRKVIAPHPDVASGRFRQAEFAADLNQVYNGEGAPEYVDPREFFQRTFLTEGLRRLLRNALLRLSGQGGDPVIELQTNFGGGKTHSLLALYHLCGGTPASELAGVEGLVKETGVALPKQVRRAVLVGNAFSPAQSRQKPDGITLNTLWGELAWQLGGKEGFALVAQADAHGVSPGSDALRELLQHFGPCLILIDEWLTYVRQCYHKFDLPGGSFDANISFAQALTEAACQVNDTLLVASLPSSQDEAGGEGGRQALIRLQHTFSRVEAAWRPASAEEGFEIVRRRLFQPFTEEQQYRDRDATAVAFSRLYQENPQEFPSVCREGEYLRRLKAAYPIHPELFDRLYGEWSSLERFQRTRGVLRLMAAVIHVLWERNDSNPLIMPATIPIDAEEVRSELTKFLEDQWAPIIEKDVDGPHSLPLTLDRENTNLGRYSACRRVARTIYFGSAPTVRTSNRGLEERNIKLGCVQPGESVAVFGDALRRLTDRATHLYVDGQRYWFATQPTVTRLARDRAEQKTEDEVWEELGRRVRAECLDPKKRGEFAGIHVLPETSADVADEQATRLVVLGPKYAHIHKEGNSPARQAAETFLTQRGNAPRLYRNSLVFLAPDQALLQDLKEAISLYLAWQSIVKEREELNLDAFQTKLANTQLEQCEGVIASRLKETYIWLLFPTQPKPQEPVVWEERRLQGPEALAVRASQKLLSEVQLVTRFAPANLRLELDRHSLWRGADHIKVKQLWNDFASYNYLPRLRDAQVLMEAIQEGVSDLVWTQYFAYADLWDEKQQRYLGLKYGQPVKVDLYSDCLLVKPEAASRQKAAEEAAAAGTSVATGGTGQQATQWGPGMQPGGGGIPISGGSNGGVGSEGGVVPPPGMPGRAVTPGEGGGIGAGLISVSDREADKLQRFHGSVRLDPVRLSRDAGRIAEEVLQHLTGLLGAEVEVTLEIQARVPAGVPDHVSRVVTENCRTLGFKEYGFERE